MGRKSFGAKPLSWSIGERGEDGKPNAMTGGRAWDAGAVPMEEWTTYRVTGETLQKLAERGGETT